MIDLQSAKMGPWQWKVSFLLLFATMINYMDRQALSVQSVRISNHFDLNKTQFGDIEFAFQIAFALGSLFWGVLADRFPVRWVYPFVLFAWSAVGFVTGWSHGFTSLLICRAALGFFESGHWPCALVVTHAILTGAARPMGNSILQSGASLGAISTPIIIDRLVSTSNSPEAWRTPFWIIGSIGLVWVAAWLFIVRAGSFDKSSSQGKEGEVQPSHFDVLMDIISQKRFWALLVMVVSINMTWQLIRTWLPMFLQEGRGYSERVALYFNSAYFAATDVGCLCAGAGALMLAKRGWSSHQSRIIVYAICAGLSALTLIASVLPASPALLGVMLIVGAGTLGLFPCYYSFTQELGANRVGRVTGILSCLGWLIPSPINHYFGKLVDTTHSFDTGIALIGLAPLCGLIAILLLWPRHEPAA